MARSGHVAHRCDHAVDRRPPRPAGIGHRRCVPRDDRSRRRRHLRDGDAHRAAAAALSVGARRLQGQDQLVHALSGHRHRHRRTAGAGADHPVRRQGQRDVSGRRRARLGRAGLYRRRLRILGQGLRHVGRRRTRVARVGRSHPGRNAAGLRVRLSQPQSLARALLAHHLRLADLPRRRWWRWRCSIRRWPRALRGCRSRPSRSSASR